jgi:hypothetical protein
MRKRPSLLQAKCKLEAYGKIRRRAVASGLRICRQGTLEMALQLLVSDS